MGARFRCNIPIPRLPRLAAGDLAYHVLNRRVGRLPLFDKPADYAAIEKVDGQSSYQASNFTTRIGLQIVFPEYEDKKRGRESFSDETVSGLIQEPPCPVDRALLLETSRIMS